MLEKACVWCRIVAALAIIGAINWGLVGALDFNLVAYLFGAGSLISRIIYVIVGLSGIALLIGYFVDRPSCKRNRANRDLDL